MASSLGFGDGGHTIAPSSGGLPVRQVAAWSRPHVFVAELRRVVMPR